MKAPVTEDVQNHHKITNGNVCSMERFEQVGLAWALLFFFFFFKVYSFA